MSTARARAEAEQREASDPRVSAFVSASAGSGKTKLLTDRLLRLMLAGADPGRIQCLTYTKAAAAEMAVRLQKKLGVWVTAPQDVLDAELHALAIEADEKTRAKARQLFATVLDLPGGMRISTIHAFCQSLLRRFPLEACLSPHFELLDETAARALQIDARESALTSPAADQMWIDAVAPQMQIDGFSGLLRFLASRPEKCAAAMARGIDAIEAAQRRALGVAADESEQDVLRAAITALDLPRLRRAMRKAEEGINGFLKDKIPAALAWLADAPPDDPAAWHGWARYFLRQDGAPCHHKYLVSAPSEKKYPGLRQYLIEEQERVCAVLERLRTLQVARLSAALMRLALPALAGYEERKQGAGLLDYGDLIGRTRLLLRDPGAAWVLYKLDGGLDHLLLDEVQDTAPEQWQIADALTAEFFAGSGARAADPPRSVFAVGDHKQSIFSFQGAAPEDFEKWRAHLQRRTEQAEQGWRNVTLDVSFRSTAPVLNLVDAVFADPAIVLGVADQAALRHLPDRAGHAGRIDLWPLTPRPAKPEPLPWETPDSARAPPGAAQSLADALAEYIAGEIGVAELPSRGRKLHAGDILVLVRSRGAFDRALLRALKKRGVAVAGLDRMVLTEQPAVADLLSLCDALLLPEDELSLACVLTSPLGNLADDSMMQLALHRRGTLWETLRARAAERADWQAAHDFLAALYRRIDYVTPHALLSEALGRLGGRARLFARLGPQSGEAIDELLNAALTYAERHPPSLQGFVHWLRQSGSEVKRDAEGAAQALRIMTVHGAKGLQAPMVILPASVGLSAQRPSLVWVADPQGGADVPLWSPRLETQDELTSATLAQMVAKEREEHYRLLYVALTRAEDRLLICGVEPFRAQPASWYDAIRAGFGRLPGCDAAPFAAVLNPWAGDAITLSSAQRAEPVRGDGQAEAAAVPVPGWAGASRGWAPAAPPDEPALPVPLAPSRPADDKLGPVPLAASPLALRDASGRRFRRGQLLHSLLQHLPNLPPQEREDAARGFLNHPGAQLAPGEAESLAVEVLDLLNRPDLAPLFGPGSRAEVPLTGVIDTPDGRAVVGGLVDRLVELPDDILIADYKTNRERPAQTPALYIRQLASYRAVLALIFPGRRIRSALIWTRTAEAEWIE